MARIEIRRVDNNGIVETYTGDAKLTVLQVPSHYQTIVVERREKSKDTNMESGFTIVGIYSALYFYATVLSE